MAGFEPTTSSSRTKRATKLRHTPCEAPTAYRTGYLESQTATSAPTARSTCAGFHLTVAPKRESQPRRGKRRTGFAASFVGFHLTVAPKRGLQLRCGNWRATGSNSGLGGVIRRMTVLGAFIYLGFFALAALWLVLTAETDQDQDQLPERSNSESTSADPEVSSPWALSQSASK